MDPRKQKRLGPAPIASFEKSFEDSTTTTIATTTTTTITQTVGSVGIIGGGGSGGSFVHSSSINSTATTTTTTTIAAKNVAAVTKDINRNGEKMESHESHKGTTTTTAATTTTATTTTTTKGRESTLKKQQQIQQQQQQQQPISISVSVSSSESTKSIHDGGGNSTTTKRPPPLKATTAAGSKTTTLVNSAEEKVLMSYKGTATLTTPSTPRIELSRASSSSHHEEDSRESSPDNVFEQVGTGTLQEAIVLGFREEGALELRSSTEELYFMDPETKKEEQEKMQQQQQQQQVKRSSPQIFKFDEHQSYLQQHQRKDSASSEVAALLCISGRTSRISSVGSQGSAVSRLSAVSGVSRSPSPHRMLLETSFCGPKPLENLVDGHASATAEPATAELLEQVLLARKHDPTQVVLAEGIKVQSSPKKKPPTSLSNGDAKIQAKIATQNRPSTGATAKSATIGAQRRSSKSPGQMVVGKTPSGTEYIRINLKPDHMYEDKGVGPNERVVEAPNSLAPVYARSQKKPASLSLGRNTMDETRLTPTASPKPTRHSALSKDSHGSRSPSPATISVSRKSSFSSLFRLGGKDSPDSPRERSRSRSKSKERGQTPQSQNVTPNKQKSVLAIFKPGKRGSSAGTDTKSSKSSSPIDVQELQQHHHHPQNQRSKNNTPLLTATGSRPASRLRYYDEPVEGYIHIPLHTPPEEKEARKLLQGIQQLNVESVRPASAPITASQLAAAAAALKPVGARKDSGAGLVAAAVAGVRSQPQQSERVQRIENLDAIQTLPQDDDNKERNWSMEVNRHSSQDSQESRGSDGSYASAIKVSVRSNLANVKENVVQENGTAAEAEIHRLPSVDSACESKIVETIATINVNITQQIQQESASVKEKRRLLFATRLGSGSQEQIFSTQFSISKTESQSSQLSEQMQETIVESPVSECLQRQDTVIRRSEDEADGSAISAAIATSAKGPLKRLSSTETAAAQRQKSVSTSEDEKSIVHTTVAAVVLRRKESNDELRRKSRSTSEEDAEAGGIASQRHSRYLENFDVRKKYHENLPRKPKRQSISETSKSEAPEETPELATVATTQQLKQPTLPQPPPPSITPSPSPPPTAAHSAIASRSPTPPSKNAAAQPLRSQSQSPVDRSRQTPTKPPRTTTPTRRTQTTPPSPSPTTTATVTPLPIKKYPTQSDRQSANSTDEPVESSESERDSDLAGGSIAGSVAAIDPKRRHLPRHVGAIEDHESTGLVSQESFDDELPYVPTTLPEERAQGIPLIPMKERANMELKTCPVDRPRSTTPLNPSHLEEYCGIVTPQEQTTTYELPGALPVRGEKLRISLPRKDSAKDKVQSSKSPRRTSNASGKSWFEFAEEGIRAAASNLERKDSNKQLLQQQQQSEPETRDNQQQKQPKTTKIPQTTKVLHGKTVQSTHTTPTSSGGSTTTSTSTQRKLSGHWIDFENIPEKRKPPKRITTLPKDGGGMSSVSIGNGGSRAQQHAAATFATTAHHHHHGHHHTQPDVTASTANSDGNKLHYNYVKPEDCQCECHEVQRGDATGATCSATTVAAAATGTGAGKVLTTVDLLQQGEDMLPLLDPDTQDGIEPSDSSREYSCYTDDEMDVPMRHSGSSRSKSSSSKLDEFPRRDVSHSPRAKKFPDNRK